MRTFWALSLAFLVSVCSSVSAGPFQPYTFTIQKNEYRFSTSFEINSEKTYPGKVDKSILGVRTWYYLYDLNGHQQAYGVCSFFCLGLFYNWATEIYVYRGRDCLGWIDGQVGTTAAAKFSIYNASGSRVAIAYLDQNKTGFEIVDPETGNVRIVSLKRQFVVDTVDHWKVVVYRAEVDAELIRIFAAFAIDRQNSWKKDN